MTGRAIPSAINWAQLLKQTAPADKKLMAAFKMKSDVISANFVKASNFNRTIDWAHYEKTLDNKDLVASFKAQFEATEIPVPSDNGLEEALKAKAVEDEAAVAAYLSKVDGQIADASVNLDAINALPPFEQMTQQDILYFFPQLCRNQEAIKDSRENDPMNQIQGGSWHDIGLGNADAWTDEMVADQATAQSNKEFRLDEAQYPGSKYPAFFSSFPSAEFKESFALADPLLQWEQIAHHPSFDAEVNAIQEAEGVTPGFRA